MLIRGCENVYTRQVPAVTKSEKFTVTRLWATLSHHTGELTRISGERKTLCYFPPTYTQNYKELHVTPRWTGALASHRPSTRRDSSAAWKTHTGSKNRGITHKNRKHEFPKKVLFHRTKMKKKSCLTEKLHIFQGMKPDLRGGDGRVCTHSGTAAGSIIKPIQ